MNRSAVSPLLARRAFLRGVLLSVACAACGGGGAGGHDGAAARDGGGDDGQTGLKYTVGGTLTGLLGGGLELQNNGGDDKALGADGAFTFATPLADGASYAV